MEARQLSAASVAGINPFITCRMLAFFDGPQPSLERRKAQPLKPQHEPSTPWGIPNQGEIFGKLHMYLKTWLIFICFGMGVFIACSVRLVDYLS